MPDLRLVTREEIEAAKAVLAGRVHRTPTITSAYLSDRIGARVSLKLELFQKTGSFKVRGAVNRMAQLSAEERSRGVVSVSAGNHAQAVAWAAREIGVAATVVMPAKAVRSKVEATRGYGAEVLLTEADLLTTVEQVREERGLVFIPPFDDRHIVAGAATAGSERLDETPDPDLIVVGVGGGGIVSGVLAAVAARSARARVIGVEPEGAAGMALSVAQGSPARLVPNTIADGLAAPWAGSLNFEHVRQLNGELVKVSDAEIIEAMWTLIERCKVVAEPAAAASVAALLSGKVVVPPGSRVVCLITGGNVDRERLRSLG